MSKRDTDLLNYTIALLKGYGVHDIHLEQSRHMKVKFTYRNQNLMATVPVSSGNDYGEKNQKTQIRRIIREADERAAILR